HGNDLHRLSTRRNERAPSHKAVPVEKAQKKHCCLASEPEPSANPSSTPTTWLAYVRARQASACRSAIETHSPPVVVALASQWVAGQISPTERLRLGTSCGSRSSSPG